MDWRLTPERNEAEDRDRHTRVPPALSPHAADHASYAASEAVTEAVNTAVALGKPLLVAGEPGVGKTRLAYYVAWRFGLWRDGDPNRPEVLRFDVKSTTTGADLLYRYDAIGHFRAVQTGGDPETRRYVDLSALGLGSPAPRGPRIGRRGRWARCWAMLLAKLHPASPSC